MVEREVLSADAEFVHLNEVELVLNLVQLGLHLHRFVCFEQSLIVCFYHIK